MPALTSSSWYVAISAMRLSSGITPASESLLALTMIMKRMGVTPVSVREPRICRAFIRSGIPALHQRRTRPDRIDREAKLFEAELTLRRFILHEDAVAVGRAKVDIDLADLAAPEAMEFRIAEFIAFLSEAFVEDEGFV